MIEKAWLVRTFLSDQVTLGYLLIGGEQFRTLERPWQDNERNRSCIPTGQYPVVHLPRSSSGKYHQVFHVQSVPGRSGILIHNGNLVSHSRGCIILGMKVGRLGSEMAVLNSRTAMSKLNEITDRGSFLLEVLQ